MRLNVINLPARADRRAQFTAWNAKAGVEIAFVDAVVGASLDRGELAACGLVTAEASHFSAGALGNALSHHKLWLEAAAAAEPTFIVEDDACLRADFAAQALGAMAQLPADWDLLFFGYNTDAIVAVQSRDGLKTLLHFDEGAKRNPNYFTAFARDPAPAPTPLHCFQAWGTLAYAISPRGAQRLLKVCFPLSGAHDIFMFGQNRKLQPYTLDGMINVALQRAPLSAYCLFPPLAVSSNDVAGSDVVS
ncbi:MAG: glycosyltransferase family 25 protein [Alphaproteobacteria bacterium]|nr:glycosyltransferase family 25 protein [Alphaproteobacteria bacterium]